MISCSISAFSIFSIFANLLHQKKEIEEDIDIRVYPAANYQRPASDRKPVNITKVSEEDYLLKYLLTEEDYLLRYILTEKDYLLK